MENFEDFKENFENTLKVIKNPNLVKDLEFSKTPLNLTYNILQHKGYTDITENPEVQRMMEHFKNNAIFRNYVEALQTNSSNIDKYSQMLKDIDFDNIDYKKNNYYDLSIKDNPLVCYNMIDNVDKVFELVDDRINENVKYTHFGINPVISEGFTTAKLYMTMDMMSLQLNNIKDQNSVTDEIKRLYDKNKSKYEFFEKNSELFDSVIEENIINQKIIFINQSIDFEQLDNNDFIKKINLRASLHKEEYKQIGITEDLIKNIKPQHEKTLNDNSKISKLTYKIADMEFKKAQESDDLDY